MGFRCSRATTLCIIILLVGGCAYHNRPLNPDTTPLERRRLNHTHAATLIDLHHLAAAQAGRPLPPTHPADPHDRDGTFVAIAISGGGLRSANFAAACLFQLQRLGLLDNVDYISCVSGGSLTAAYYCLSDRAQWNPGDVQRKLTHGFGTDILLTAIQPWNALALMCTDWDATDVLASSLDRNLFRRDGRSLTFADLRPDRPRLLINATDLQSGRPFLFVNEQFDELNSDLAQYPIAHAVAASSAVPIVLHPKTLRDYSTAYRQFRHVIDGGVNDNLGVQSLLDVYRARNSVAPGQNPPYPNGAVIIVIDAGTRYDARLSDHADIGFWQKVRRSTELASTSLIARANAATLGDLILLHCDKTLSAEELRQRRCDLEQKGLLRIADQDRRPIQVLHLALANVRRLSNVPFPSFSEHIDSISTLFDIEPNEAHLLYQAADLLVAEPQMQAALRSVLQQLPQPPPAP